MDQTKTGGIKDLDKTMDQTKAGGVKDQDKIAEALEYLNKEAKEKKGEINRLIGEKYSNIKEMMSGAVASGEEKAKEMATEIDTRVHENPWLSVGIAAAAGFLLGYAVEAACKRSK
ncbi:conserved hypothetical protein [Candidatus Jettenia caeni]|uniref:DUF883 domain-containing protein n=1 Tax=Candidatus Jettenia caeni TaxID=247490 RepID=I3IKH0_9BACT|nr:DUF883 family protein [Candidatus Jettenia sp. AMX1]WKZ14070.1 MAG: DUF883 family protein [Candidatus Jettenia caeni]GAB62215.1 conserved hypothetical protein [Candidatus Jettenia caeni]GIL19614.1 MAG: hypothetical protein BroJett041_07280 [Candidatus Jettenia caeni]GJQ44564.1 MAG: hypothetical protein JETCAE04_03180 [Candidatus Jettenia caeni]